MAKDAAEIWRECFQQWPAALSRRGVLIVSFGEQIPFERFYAGDQMLLAERRAPDTVGARMVMVPYGNIEGLKIVDVVPPKNFSALGFGCRG
jgi:hypothetical protein